MKKMKKRLEEASNREKCRIEIISELLKGKLKKMKMTDDWKWGRIGTEQEASILMLSHLISPI